MNIPPIMMPGGLGGDLGDAAAAGTAAANAAQGQPNGMALLVGVGVGLVYWWAAQRQAEGDEEGDEDDDEIDEGEVERPRRVSRLSDVTTDSLIDEPAIVASSGKAGDCYKAVKMLPGRQSLARNAHEKSIFRRVLKAVADDCREHEDVIDEALEDLEQAREEIEDELGVDTSSVDDSPERIIQAKRAAQKAVREGTLTRTRKKRVPRSVEIDVLDRVAHTKGASARGGRPRGPAIDVRRSGAKLYRLRKEKSPTKRGYKWRKEE